MSKKKKKPAKRQQYAVVVIPCAKADLYVCGIVDKAKVSNVISIASAHLLSRDAHAAAKIAEGYIRQWAIEGVQVSEGKPLVYIGAPATPVSRWILAIRSAIRSEVGSDLPTFLSIQPILEEAQRYLNCKVKAKTKHDR
jgi:hypothetical protein